MLDSDVRLLIPIARHVVIGWQEFDDGDTVGVDLTPYGARQRGVSRQHAAINRRDNIVTLVDLGSNGTYLNNVRLISHQVRLLRENDEVRLGNMCFRIYFDHQPPEALSLGVK